MYILKSQHSFDSAHFLANYEGKCKNIHGHRWKVEVEVQSETLIKEGKNDGMVIDFSDLKKDLRRMLNAFDHALIIQKGSMRRETQKCLMEDAFKIVEVTFRPTAENFSYYFFTEMEKMGYDVKRIKVYETPNNSAVYEK